MMTRAIDRSRQTGGSLATSFMIHTALLLILAVGFGKQVERALEADELTEIAYIEARYGEDVAAKVKMKQKPQIAPDIAPPARGLASDSAIKPRDPSPAPPRPEPRPALAKVETPRQRPAKVEVAEVQAPQIAPQVEQKVLAAATTKQSQVAKPKRKIIDTSKLAGTLAPVEKTAAVAKSVAPQARAKRPQTLQPQKPALQNRGGNVLGADKTIASTAVAERGSGVAEATVALGGDRLQQKSQTKSSYRSPSSALASASQSASGGAGGKGVLDVTGPSGTGTKGKKGRKTILDYGDGQGGRGGSLSGRRGSLAEPPAKRAIVEETKTAGQSQKQVAEVELTAKGVNMTITGQIAGRTILHSVPPSYSQKARTKGWEGAVAVHFTVMADGRVKDNVYLEQTSIHRDLNQAAMQAIKQFRFAPLPADQSAVEQWGVITIIFRLN